jgi:hypothetical protein
MNKSVYSYFDMINASGFKSIDILDNINYKPFTWVIQKVFIAHEPCYFTVVEQLKSYFLFIALIRDKYLLYNINERRVSLAQY